MTKAFLDVFPNLNMTDELRELLNLVEVEKVTSTRDRSSIRVYIVSPRLIHKQNIYGLEKGIKDQLFPSKQVSIKIIEKFRLSDQYTPEKLLDVYRDSILMELKNYSIIEYNIFRKTEYEFPEPDLLKMTVEDTIVTHEKEAELKRVLEKIFMSAAAFLLRCATSTWSRRRMHWRSRRSFRCSARWRRSSAGPLWPLS